jgi:capsular exopolysaccharide synthesis family protein
LGSPDEDARPDPGLLATTVANLRRKFDFLAPRTDSPERKRIEAVKKAMTVRTSLQSQVIEVYYEARNPELAAAGANAVASEFIDLNREARQEMIEQSTAWLSQQAADLKAKLESANQGLQSYAASAGLVFAGTDDSLAQDRMRQLQDALVRAEAERAAKQSRYEAVSASGKLLSEPAAADPVQVYQTELQKMRQELSQLRTIYTPNHPKIVGLETQINEIEQAIQKAREDTVGRIQNDYNAAAGLERILGDSQKRQMDMIERQMSQQRHYEVMKGEAETTQRIYQSVLENLKAVGAASSLRSTNVQVIDAATTPFVPYSPNLPLNSAIGLALGTLGGIGLVLLGGRSNRVTSPGDCVLLNIPELGVIPSASNAGFGHGQNRMLPFQRKSDPGLVTWTHDASPLSESFRATLNSILFGTFFSRKDTGRADGPAGRVLTVTSFDPMAGKTTVLSNLAVASAERKLRVLIIDADLRRPRIHSLFNVTNDWGLTDVLEQSQVNDYIQQAPLESLVRSTHISNVWVLPSGPGNAAIASLLYSAGLTALLQRFRAEFDLIFVDSPPLMLYSDARMLGRLSDGLVMVIRSNTRSREELQAVYARLVEDRIHVMGTVLNGWEMDSRQSREYGSQYSRYQQPTERTT